MPAVDVDVTAIPDMIEAQLTLSYSRLAHLVRLIVDQGNGHELDIDKLTSRIDTLTHENAELRSVVDSLMEERTSESDSVRRELEALRAELARVSDTCGANTERIAAADALNAERFANVDNCLQAQGERAEAMFQQSSAASAVLSDNVRALGQALHAAEDFVALWSSDPSRAAVLSRRSTVDSDSGAVASFTEECTQYLHSLPAFVRVFEEIEVVRQILRQQSSDALTAKTVAGAIRRTSAAEAAAFASAANAIERSAIESLQSALEDMNRRVRTVETKRLPPLEHAVRFQQYCAPQSQPQSEASAGEAQPANQVQRQSQSWARREDISPLADRMCQLEERLRGLTFQAASGAGIEQAVLGDMDGRIRVLENIVDGSSHELLQSQQHEHCEPGQQQAQQENQEKQGNQGKEQGDQQLAEQQPQPTQQQKEEGQRPPTSTTRPGSSMACLSSPCEAPGKYVIENKSTNPRASSLALQPPLVNQPNVSLYRRHTSVPGAVADPENHVQLLLEEDDGLRRRVAQLEENCAILEMHKANRVELQQLEKALRQSLSMASSRGVSQQHQRQQEYQLNGVGQAAGGPYPYPMFGQQVSSVPYIPQRPTSAQDGRAAVDGRMGYATEVAQGSMSAPASGGGVGALGRPMFAGNSAHYLRDSKGVMTCATIAPSHPR